MSTHHHPRQVERHCDVAIVGGSAAGLAAALQLGRQRRSVIVVDAGEPRNAPATHMHGYLGRDGTPPSELTSGGRAEVRSYGGEVLDGRVINVARPDDAHFRVELVGGHSIVARRVLAATGLVDELPDIDGLADQWGRGVIHCPFCHGFEARDRHIVQIVTHPRGLHTAVLFRQLSEWLTVVVDGAVAVERAELDRLRASGVELVAGHVTRIVTDAGGEITAVELSDHEPIAADVVAITPRFRVRADAFASLGLRPAPHPIGTGDHLETDATGQTAIPGVYAAGNVTDPGQQVLQAAADGARVGAMISFSLAEEDVRHAARPSANATDWDHRYGGEPIWSGNPNGTLVREVAEVAPGRALDVGAGEGADALWLAERGWKVTANDISQRALDRVEAESRRRGLSVECQCADANALNAFPAGAFDLVSAQYASIPRTPDGRGVQNLLDAVAPGGTLLVVSHDLAPMRTPIDTTLNSRAFDPDAYVRVDDVKAALTSTPSWNIEVDEKRPRPAGSATASVHVDDVVLRASRIST
jgi:thioredoxin reductase/SAM-dependent methyltransferase